MLVIFRCLDTGWPCKSCETEQNTLTHTSAVSWRRQVNAAWRAPSNFTGRVVFRATLVEEYRVIIYKLLYCCILLNILICTIALNIFCSKVVRTGFSILR